MSKFFFVRHGATDDIGKTISGRAPGVHINSLGQEQAVRLARRLAAEPIEAIYCSPQLRARETAAPLAQALAKQIVTAAELDEVDLGQR